MRAGVAAVTGGGQGFGRAFCQGLAEAGHPVAVADLNFETAEAVAADINKDGGKAIAVKVDVSDETSVAQMRETIEQELGDLVVLVNNAAYFSTIKKGSYADLSLETWNQVFAVNATGVFLTCREFAPAMAERGYGKIVNISSGNVFAPQPGYVHYVASKGAVHALTRALAVEASAQGVRVNTVSPGPAETEIEREGVTHESLEMISRFSALKKVMVPDDLVGAVVFLASPASDFITGQTLNVDGGLNFH